MGNMHQCKCPRCKKEMATHILVHGNFADEVFCHECGTVWLSTGTSAEPLTDKRADKTKPPCDICTETKEVRAKYSVLL
jgi:hypothetical protein